MAVVGAGIGGATAALALARRGLRVLALERAPAWRPVYKGEYLQPRSIVILEGLGAGPAIRAATHPVYRSRMGRDDGTTLLDFDMRGFGAGEGRNGPHRAIQAAVLDALAPAGADLRLGAGLEDLRRVDGGWILRTAAGEHSARLVVGADGPASTVRTRLGIPVTRRAYPGVAWAVTIDLEEDAPPRVDQLFGDADSAFFFPLPERQARLYLLFSRDREWHAAKAAPDGGLGHLRRRLTAYFPDMAGPIAAIPAMADVQVIPSFYQLAARWSADGALLLGDAAHVVNPARGQGMNLAIADAAAAAEVLPAAVREGDLSARRLDAVRRRRLPYVRYVQHDSDNARRLFLSTNPAVRAVRDRVFRNTTKAPRAAARTLATLAGLLPPPGPVEEGIVLAAYIWPALDRLVPVHAL